LIADPPAIARKLLHDLSALRINGLHMPDAQQLAKAVDPALSRSQPRDSQASGAAAVKQRELLAALKAGVPTHPELKRPMLPDQLLNLERLESARRQQMSAAAYQSLADAKKSRAKTRSLLYRTVNALRYVPLNPLWWHKQLRRGALGLRLRQHFRACSIAMSGAFDSDWYGTHYSDVARSNIDPLLHFVRFGAAEGRDPAPSYSTKERLHNMLRIAETTSD